MHNNRMMIYDLSKRSARFVKLKEMVECEPFQVIVLEYVVSYFETNPSLPADEASEIG